MWLAAHFPVTVNKLCGTSVDTGSLSPNGDTCSAAFGIRLQEDGILNGDGIETVGRINPKDDAEGRTTGRNSI